MDIEEAKKMVGTEFTYIYADGDTILAYVKKFDPGVGLTCMTLETGTRRDSYKNKTPEADGTWCVIAYDFKTHDIEGALKDLNEIKNTGCFQAGIQYGLGDSPACAFM